MIRSLIHQGTIHKEELMKPIEVEIIYVDHFSPFLSFIISEVSVIVAGNATYKSLCRSVGRRVYGLVH